MTVKCERRRKYFVDSKVQSALLKQLLCYWLLGSFALVTATVVYRVAPLWLTRTGDPFAELWRQIGPVLIISAFVAPIVLTSAIRFSNRFVGPMLRFRRILNSLAQGEVPPPVKLRDDDYWGDVAADLNQVIRRMSPATPPVPKDVESNGSEEQVAV